MDGNYEEKSKGRRYLEKDLILSRSISKDHGIDWS
jgi:hypothetical protein